MLNAEDHEAVRNMLKSGFSVEYLRDPKVLSQETSSFTRSELGLEYLEKDL